MRHWHHHARARHRCPNYRWLCLFLSCLLLRQRFRSRMVRSRVLNLMRLGTCRWANFVNSSIAFVLLRSLFVLYLAPTSLSRGRFGRCSLATLAFLVVILVKGRGGQDLSSQVVALSWPSTTVALRDTCEVSEIALLVFRLLGDGSHRT